ncbi:MAG: O-antigen ligase family protein [Marinosulfonomonas sp.]
MSFAPLAPPPHPVSAIGLSGRVLILLIGVRWLAGIGENFGFGAISELAGLGMLLILGLLTLADLRLAAGSALFVTGILAWLFVALLSCIANTEIGVLDAVSLFALLALYGLFMNAASLHFRDPSILGPVRIFTVMFILVGGALSLVQVVTGTGFVEAGKETVMRAFGSDVHPVSFSIQMVLALVILEVVRVKEGRPVGILHLGLLALGLLAIYLTFARTAWAMALLVVTYCAFANAKWGLRIVSLGGVILAVTAALLWSDRFSDLRSLPQFLSHFSFDNAAFDFRYIDNSLSWRVVNWTYGFQQALEQPLFGFGPGQSAQSSYFNLEMHNIVLETFFEGGVFGVIALLITLGGLVMLHHRLPATSAAERYVRSLTNGFGCALLLAVLLSTSLVDQLMTILMYLLLLAVTGSVPGVAAISPPQPVADPRYFPRSRQDLRQSHC